MIGKIREAEIRRGIIWTESGIDTRRPLHASDPHERLTMPLWPELLPLVERRRGRVEAVTSEKSERHGACYQIHLPAASHPSIL